MNPTAKKQHLSHIAMGDPGSRIVKFDDWSPPKNDQRGWSGIGQLMHEARGKELEGANIRAGPAA